MKLAPLLFAIGWMAIFFTLVCYVDFDSQMQPLIQISDYLMTFHVAGFLVAHGQAPILYPPADAITFAGMPFDKAAHVLLSKMPVSSVAEFMYMPLAATVFVPFSFLPLNWSLFFWQLASLVSLGFSVHCLWLARGSVVGSEGTFSDSFIRMVAPLWLLPVCLTIWIGQVGLVFGMLPLALGYLVLWRNKPFIAGMIWSLAIFKPQFLVPAFVVLFALLVRKQVRAAVGICAGVVLILLSSVCIFGAQLNIDWLHCLKISDIVYSDPRSGIATHIATSLPRTLILAFASNSQLPIKALAYGLAGTVFASALFAAWKSLRSANLNMASSENNLSENLQLPLLVGIFVTPLVMPHFFLFDYCLFGLILPLALFSTGSAQLSWSIKKVLLLAWVVINIYSVVVLVAHQFASPLLFMCTMLLVYILLLRAIWLPVPVSKDTSTPDILVSN